MAEIGWAGLGILPVFDKFGSELEQGTAKHMTAAGVSGGTKFGDAAGKSASKRFSSAVKTAGKVAALGLAAVGAVAFKLGKDSIAEARESQKVGALTTSTIKATGKAAKVTAKQVGDLAGAISAKSGIDDEVIQSGANMILTFKNIRNEAGKGNKIFDSATRATADMAAAMAGGSGEVDLKSSSILVGKALNDPIKGLSALSRVGIQFTAEQKDQIKALAESGQTMKAQKLVLRELESQFGGAAEAQATMGEKASVAWGNIKEGIGTALLPLLDDVQEAFLEKGVPAAEKFVGWFEDKGVDKIRAFGGFIKDDVVPAIGDFADEARPLAKSILPAMGDALGIARDALKTAAPFAKDMVDAFNDMPDWAKTAIVGGGAGLFASKKLGLLGGGKGGGLTGGGGLLGLVTKTKPIPVFVVNNGVGGVPGGKGGKVPIGVGLGSAYGAGALLVGGAATAGIMKLDQKYAGGTSDGLAGSPPASVGGGGGLSAPSGWLDFSDSSKKAAVETERTAKQIGLLRDASDKLYRNASNGADRIGSASNYFRDEVFEAAHRVERYGSMLDGLTKRAEALFLASVNANNALGGEGSGGGQPPGRSGPLFTGPINIKADTYEDTMKKIQRRAGRATLAGHRGHL